jgi:hypothetical protein
MRREQLGDRSLSVAIQAESQIKDRADDGISMRFAPKAINAGFFVSA